MQIEAERNILILRQRADLYIYIRKFSKRTNLE